MTLTNVWVQTHADGLVRADQVIGIEAHTTAGLRDTQSHWLLDVVLATSVGSGFREGWNVTALHRTLAQTAVAPQGAAAALAELLARLDVMSAAGVIDVVRDDPGKNSSGPDPDGLGARSGGIRFRFQPFRTPAADDRTDAEYL